MDFAVTHTAEHRVFRCGCGEKWHAVPYEGRRKDHPNAPRFCAPKLNPCGRCTVDLDAQREELVRSRLRGAGIPDPLWRFRLDEDSCIGQRSAESDETFMARVRADELGRMGVARANKQAVRAVFNWLRTLREGEHRRWLVLHGPPGTGKTALLSALARGLLTTEPDQRVPLEDDELTVRPEAGQAGMDYAVMRDLHTRIRRGRPAPETRYLKVNELGRVDGESWESDSQAVSVAKSCRVLLLDELGLDPDPQKWEARAVENVLSKREECNRVTVMATNRSPEELVDGKLYGYRVSSRLGMATIIPIGGPSWRRS